MGTVTEVEEPTLLVTVTVTDSIVCIGWIADDEVSLLVSVNGT